MYYYNIVHGGVRIAMFTSSSKKAKGITRNGVVTLTYINRDFFASPRISREAKSKAVMILSNVSLSHALSPLSYALSQLSHEYCDLILQVSKHTFERKLRETLSSGQLDSFDPPGSVALA